MARLLAEADLVRPQNYFDPLPWHARWDTARILCNRAFGSDFPGTLGVRSSFLRSIGGYDGDVLFENLELIRTVTAAGGRVIDAPDLFVRRRPPTVARFLEQRPRQAYDDWAQPLRFAVVPRHRARGRRRDGAAAWAFRPLRRIRDRRRRLRQGSAPRPPRLRSALAPPRTPVGRRASDPVVGGARATAPRPRLSLRGNRHPPCGEPASGAEAEAPFTARGLNGTILWVPSQKGCTAERPQRQSALIRRLVQTSRPCSSTRRSLPLTSSGPS